MSFASIVRIMSWTEEVINLHTAFRYHFLF